MPPMPYYYVGKGMELRVTDDWYAGKKSEYMKAHATALAMLEGEGAVSFEEMASENAALGRLTINQVEHFEQDWLTDAGGWWPEHPVRELLHHGFLEAVKIAQEAGLPIEALWVCAEKSEFNPCQVYICKGPRQVTVILYTPPPGEWVTDNAVLTEPEHIWVVKVRDEYDGRMTGSPLEHLADVRDKEIIKRQLMCTPPPSMTAQS